MASGNVKNYISNPKSSFFSLEDDVDDEEFLKNSRTSYSSSNRDTTSYGGQSNTNPFYNNREIDSLEEKRLQLLQRKKEIEERTLSSTERSLGLLRESEQVGIATAEELQKQREQLERTEKSLDNINTTLRFTQKNIDGIKSVFSSIKNYLGKKSEQNPVGGSKDPPITPIDRESYLNEARSNQLPATVHPGLKLRGLEEDPRDSIGVNDRIDQNLDHMAYSISTLKGLATNLGEEIISQNELVDNIMYKAEKADFTINKQNKDMNRLLKKK